MTEPQHTTTVRAIPEHVPLDLESATRQIVASALHDDPVGAVGIELEGHVFVRADPSAHPDFETLAAILEELPVLPGGGRTSLEPGGQLEISSAVHRDCADAIGAMREDAQRVRGRLADVGLGWALIGSDPLRPPKRVSPAARYACMETWFEERTESGLPGRTMMCSTASIQVNLQAGRRHEWASRVRRAQRLGPLLTALTGTSAYLRGRSTDTHSARQSAWFGLEPATSGFQPESDDPVGSWVERALDAPVIHLPRNGTVVCADRVRSLRDWLLCPGEWPDPTLADVQRHLTLLFPPVRLRGFLELRCLDSMPDPWWPAICAATVAWMDDERIRSEVDDALTTVVERWDPAVHRGLGDRVLAAAACRLLTAAHDVVPADLRPPITELRRLALLGESPGSQLARALHRRGPADVLEELAHA